MAEVTEIKIEQNIPVPVSVVVKKYPFDQLEIGESFFLPGQVSGAVGSVRQRWEKKLSRKFTTRTVTVNSVKGIRVWRVS